MAGQTLKNRKTLIKDNMRPELKGDYAKLEDIVSSVNVAEMLSERKLREISQQVLDGMEADEQSRSEWMDITDSAMDIAKQVFETKSEPFEGAANIKFPMITQAVMEFGSRTFAEITRNNRVIRFGVVGRDPEGAKYKKAQRLTEFHNYQLLYEQKEWKKSVDKALHVLPMTGVVHRKVFYDEVKDKIRSELCDYKDIIVNHNVPSLEEAPRITHRILKSKPYILSRMRLGLYLDFDLEEIDNQPSFKKMEQEMETHALMDEQHPYTLVEQHCWIDLDNDDFPEPYIVILHENTGKVLRIVPRFEAESIEMNSEGQVVDIEPEHYFSDWHCLPSPDGGYWSIGFGQLLYPLNEACNSIINQLVDAGTLNNQQAGMLTRQVRMRGGDMKFQLGEWKFVDVLAGTSLKDNIFPLPTKEPSPTLFQLLGLLIDVSKDLSSITDVLQGKQPAQNVAASTVATLEKQGLTLYNAMQKRLFYALKEELEKVFTLVKKYVDPRKYQKVIGEKIDVMRDPQGDLIPVDFLDDAMDVQPVFDPASASDTQRLQKLQQMLQNVPDAINVHIAAAAAADILQLEIPGLVLAPPAPDAPPPPKDRELLKKVEVMDAEIALKLAELEKIKAEIIQLPVDRAEVESRIAEAQARIQKMRMDAENNAQKIKVQAQNVAIDAQQEEKDIQLRTMDRMIDSQKVASEQQKAVLQVEADLVKTKAQEQTKRIQAAQKAAEAREKMKVERSKANASGGEKPKSKD